MSPNAPKISVFAEGPRLRFWQQLQFRLGILFLITALILGVTAWKVGEKLVQQNIVADAQRYQRESGQRLKRAVEHQLKLTHVLAGTVAEMRPEAGDWISRVTQAVESSGIRDIVAGIGWWPEPSSGSTGRKSRLLLLGASSSLQLREDYNNPNVIAYWKEPWYTPARYAPEGNCYWTPLFTERLSKRRVVNCTLPVRNRKGFAGAVTVLLDAKALEKHLRQESEGQSGYSLLIDRSNQVIASAGKGTERISQLGNPTVAGLAQAMPPLNALALELHAQNEQFLTQAAQSPRYDATAISSLVEETNDYSRADAESALAVLWTGGPKRRDPALPLEEFAITSDTVIEQDASATLFSIGEPNWKLVRTTPQREGVKGAQYFFQQTLIVVVGATLIALVMIYSGLRFWLLRPLHRMASQLSRARSPEEAAHVQVESSGSGEIGVIGHWFNERGRQLRESTDRLMTQQGQLIMESGERSRADEQSFKFREKLAALSASVADAIVTVDSHGTIEEFNIAAERASGVLKKAAIGKPFKEILHFRLANQSGVTPDFAANVLASSTRIEHTDGLFLQVDGRDEKEIQFVGTPIRGNGGQVLGAVLIFHSRSSTSSAPQKLIIDRRSVDPVTGLPGRANCDRRLRNLIESARGDGAKHTFVIGDLDRLRHVNETHGVKAGDQALARVSETLSTVVPASDLYRLGADSFALVVENHDLNGAEELGSTLCNALSSRTIQWEEKSFTVTGSFGLVVFDGSSGGPMDVFRMAESACAAAKQAGRNTHRVFEESMANDELIIDEELWVKRIRAGLDEGLFHMTTQWVEPRDSHKREGQVYAISLALEDEEGFWAAPESYIHVAEHHGLGSEVERWAIRQTLLQLARNETATADIAFCSLQMSAQAVQEGATLELLAEIFEEHPEIKPQSVCFALREDVLSDAPGAAQTFCDAMHSLGCRIALDHFLTHGAADIELMRRLPADFMRVDSRHFVDISGDAVDQAIAESLIKLSRTLSRRIIVTEIADEASRQTWKRMGADYLQGLCVARPSPVIFVPSV